MPRTTQTLLSLLVCFGLAAPVGAQTADQETATLETLSGRTYAGKVISDDGSKVEIETRAGAVMTLPYEQLTLPSQYRLQRARTTDTGESHLALAEWAVEKTLYTEAKRHYHKALAADMTLEDTINKSLTAARTTAANEILTRAKQLTKDGKPKEARALLTTIAQELPLEQAAEEAKRLLSEDNEHRKKTAMQRTPARSASSGTRGPGGARGEATRASGEPFSEEARKTFKNVIAAYHKMLDATTKGLLDGSGVNDFEKAVKEGEKALKATAKIRSQGEQNAEIAEALLLVDAKLEEGIVEARVNMADAYLIRGSDNQAAEAVNHGIAMYPNNSRLRQAKNRVTAAATDGDGIGWAIGARAIRGPGRGR